MKAINVKRLQKAMACEDQIKSLRALIGDKDAPLTIEFAVEHAHLFDWDWAASNLLSYKGYLEYINSETLLWTSFYIENNILVTEYKAGLAAKLFATIYLKDTK